MIGKPRPRVGDKTSSYFENLIPYLGIVITGVWKARLSLGRQSLSDQEREVKLIP